MCNNKQIQGQMQSNFLSFWNLDSVQQFLTHPIECSKEIDNFLSRFSSTREEIGKFFTFGKKNYRCKLNKEVPQPPLIAILLEKLLYGKAHDKCK
jgi:hypothetical protein